MDSVLAVGPATAMDDPNPASDVSVSNDPAESSDDATRPESNKLATTPPRRKLKSLSAVLASPSDTSSISSECSSSYASTAAMTTATADVTAETIITTAEADVTAESIVPNEGESSTNDDASETETETSPREAQGETGESGVHCEAYSEAASPLRSPPSLATVDRYPSERNVRDRGAGKDDEDDDGKDENEEKNEKESEDDDDKRVEEEEFATAVYDLNLTADCSEVNEADHDENDDESGDDIQGRKGKDVFKGIAEGVALNIVVTKDELDGPKATADSCCQVDEEVDEYDGANSNDNDDDDDDDDNLEIDDAGEGAPRDGDGDDVDGGGFLVPGARDLPTPHHHPAVVEAATSSVWSGVLDSISLVGSGSAVDADDCCDDVNDRDDAVNDNGDGAVQDDISHGGSDSDSDSDSDSSSSDDEEEEDCDNDDEWAMAAADSELDDNIANLKTDLAKAAMRLVTPPEEEPVGGDDDGDNHRLLRSDSYRDSHSTDGNGGSSGNCKSSSLVVGSLSLSATEEGERGDVTDLLLAAADEEDEVRAAISVGGEPIDDTLGLVLSGGSSHVGNCLDAPNGVAALRHVNSVPPSPDPRARRHTLTAPDPPLPPSPLPSSPGSAMSPFDLASSGSPPTPDLRRMCFRRRTHGDSAPDHPPLGRPSLPRIPRSVPTSVPRCSVPSSVPRSVITTSAAARDKGRSDGYDGVFRRRLPIVEWYDRNRLVADAIDGALEAFPTDVDAPPPDALRELALLGGSGTRSLCSSLDSDDGRGSRDVTESLKVLPLSDASYRVRFENKRIMLRLMCEIFDRYNSNAVPVGPFFELSIRRRSVRRAGSRTRSRGSGLSTATGMTSVASSRQPHRRRQRAASPPLENVAEERKEATAANVTTDKAKEAKKTQRHRDEGDGSRRVVTNWSPVYRSYPLPRTSRPAWEALDVGDLGGGGDNNEEDVPVRIDVYDAAPRPSQQRADRRGGGGRLIGSFVASSKDLLAASTSTEGPAVNAGTGAKYTKHRGGRGGRLRLRHPRRDAGAKAEDSNHGTEPIDEDCRDTDCDDNYKRDHRSRHSGGGRPNEGVLFPLTRNGKKKGWVRVRAERADDDGTRNGGGHGGGGVRLQLEMRLPRVRIGGQKGGATASAVQGDGCNEGVAQTETTAACHPHNKGGGRGLVHIRRRRPSPYFEISLPKEEGSATDCHDGKEERREVLGDVHWDWCTIYRSYPVLSKGRCPSWEALEVILPPDAGRTGDAPVRVAVYDSAKGGGSHVERCLASKAAAEAAAAAEGGEGGGGGAASPAGSTSTSTSPTSSSASSRVPGFVGAFEARVWDLTQGEERRFALIGDGRQKGWIRVLATERCDL